jgi:type I restriction enzyme, S subunit
MSASFTKCKKLRRVFVSTIDDKPHTVSGSIGKKDFHAIRCTVPTRDLIHEYERRISTVDARIKTTEQESSTSPTLRDTLLPKLISGELRIMDAESFNERAL